MSEDTIVHSWLKHTLRPRHTRVIMQNLCYTYGARDYITHDWLGSRKVHVTHVALGRL